MLCRRGQCHLSKLSWTLILVIGSLALLGIYVRDVRDGEHHSKPNAVKPKSSIDTGWSDWRPQPSDVRVHPRAQEYYYPRKGQAMQETPPRHPPSRNLTLDLHPMMMKLLKQYPFQPVRAKHGAHRYSMVNIILVRAPMNANQKKLYHEYKDEILFLGISSFEDFPLPSVNPFSPKYSADEFVGLLPGFLHMLREPEKVFPPHVKTLRMSQSDFSLPVAPPRDYSIPRKYDFTYSGSDQDVLHDCVGWSSFAKNWSFVKEALDVMCGEYKLKGVLVATKAKQGERACTIPESCEGLMVQTRFLSQQEFHNYLKQSRFAFLPQIHDASPRVSSQALAYDVPLLMNAHISGGWKYVNDQTGEFFHDITDFRQNLMKILKNADVETYYSPQKWIHDNYGDEHAGPRLLKFVKDNFADRVLLPEGTVWLLPSGV